MCILSIQLNISAAVAYFEALSRHAWKDLENPRNRPRNETGKPNYQPQLTLRNLKYRDT